jgi:hypothetical protein
MTTTNKVTIKSFASDLESLKTLAVTTGATQANGDAGMLRLARAVYATTKYKTLEDGDVSAVYASYAEGRNKVALDNDLSPVIDVTNKDVMANGTSKLRNFAKLARVPNTGNFFAIVPLTLKMCNGKGHSYETALKVVRAQLVACKADKKCGPFDASDIDAVLNPPKAAFDVVAELERIRKAAVAKTAVTSDLNAFQQAPFVALAATLATLIAQYKTAVVERGDESVEDEVVEDFADEGDAGEPSLVDEVLSDADDFGSELQELVAAA